jgi:ATP-dependent RNA helicase DHX37/DHR1
MAGPPVRERYNAKARGSTAGGSHKKRKQKKPKAPVVVDEDGVPIPTGKRDEVMQEQSEDEGVYEGEGKGKMSSKKRKRLDSYIVSVRPTKQTSSADWSSKLGYLEQKVENGGKTQNPQATSVPHSLS